MKSLFKQQNYKDEFAKGVMINDTYFDSYQEFLVQENLDEKIKIKGDNFDKVVDADDHGVYVGQYNKVEPNQFPALYSNFIKSMNPFRRPIAVKKPESEA